MVGLGHCIKCDHYHGNFGYDLLCLKCHNDELKLSKPGVLLTTASGMASMTHAALSKHQFELANAAHQVTATGDRIMSNIVGHVGNILFDDAPKITGRRDRLLLLGRRV